MQYSLKDKDGTVKNYEVSYSQVLQKKTNKLLAVLIILLLIMLATFAYIMVWLELLDIPTKIIYGA